MDTLEKITALSHEFGTPDYVKGGGGNSSVKDAHSMWIKPSGTTMDGLAPDRFITMDRAAVAELYTVQPPVEAAAREALVVERMQAAVRPRGAGRPSVEAPLHNLFDAAYVVHTHPPLVNGLTCARHGAEVARALFPDALWLDYIDPGFTLAMEARDALERYRAAHGRQPCVLIMKNHGLVVAGTTPDAIRATYRSLMETLAQHYREAGVAMTLTVGPAPSAGTVKATAELLGKALGEAATHIVGSGLFKVADGPLTPDHIVYMKAVALKGELATGRIKAFADKHGYTPRILETHDAVFAVGPSRKEADLALVLAQDGALVEQLTAAFGGAEYMTERATRFIDNWEVEAYRRRQAAG